LVFYFPLYILVPARKDQPLSRIQIGEACSLHAILV